jgi:hypothetical protein
MPVTPQAVAHLQAQGHDAIHASAVGLGDKSDGEVLERARAEDRLIGGAIRAAQNAGAYDRKPDANQNAAASKKRTMEKPGTRQRYRTPSQSRPNTMTVVTK